MSEPAAVYGFHAVTARIRHRPESVQEILFDQNRRDPRLKRLLVAARERGLRVSTAQGKALDEVAGSRRHQGIVALVEGGLQPRSLADVLETLDEPALLLVLDGVQDPHNLGACLRVADALGAHAVVAPKDRAVGLTPTVEKVASGAAQTVPYVVVTNLVRELKAMNEAGIWTVGASQGAPLPLVSCDLKRPVALVLGAEGEGLRQLTRKTCDELVAIPMSGTVESLNVSVAAGICLYEARRQRQVEETASAKS
ncbi:MAG: 23S rRNA (guanosine(2251)-2'-O)-methyltransferase RlmB [Betaproteobacteria bacterium]|nr:MAG: 23S rRNA (guanosine(2251)-2'-O)-methyltransferase RlmB [Betaproteobacteria bacterium]